MSFQARLSALLPAERTHSTLPLLQLRSCALLLVFAPLFMLATHIASAQQSSALSAPIAVPAASAEDFVKSIGVNVHFNYYGSIYTTNTPLILSRLKQLGVWRLRDALCWQGNSPNNPYYALHRQLGSLGFTTDYVAYMNQPASQAAAYPSLVNDMEAIEPANEYDNSGDSAWVQHITAQLSSLYSTMRAVAPQVTVLAPSLALPWNTSLLGNVSTISQGANLHGYFGGDNPANTSTLIADAQQSAPNHPTWVTETGYFGQPIAIFGTWGVTEAVQAIYTPRALLNYWISGARRTYLYELADDFELGENPAQYAWGLLDSNGNAKPAFTALANLTQILNDPAPASGAAFTPAPLQLTISPSAPTIRYSLFEKRDGSYYLALWNEVSGYNPVTGQQQTPPAQSVVVHLSRTVLYNGTQQFDANGNYQTLSGPPSQTVTIPVSDKLQIVTWIVR